ncbi:hypothetical protein [Rhizobium leguminosarum]|uniref:hypothetical protein n=1 Tax=Rhizobium leguminosarum TaxID=384 RepID=UPI0015FA31AC|nr:hypothetical protein [Rhizobium leguminosarum]MBA9031750.1 hypothetical protein [Rhizobium leguminosarum]
MADRTYCACDCEIVRVSKAAGCRDLFLDSPLYAYQGEILRQNRTERDLYITRTSAFAG